MSQARHTNSGDTSPLEFGAPLPSFIDVVAPLRLRVTIPIDAQSARPFDVDVTIAAELSGRSSEPMDPNELRVRWETQSPTDSVASRDGVRSLFRSVRCEGRPAEPNRIELAFCLEASDVLVLSRVRVVVEVTGRQVGDGRTVPGFTRLIVLPTAIAKVTGAFAVLS